MKTAEPVLKLACNFGNLSVGDKTCRLGVSVDRKALKLKAADDNLCCHRLTGTLRWLPKGDAPEQQRMFKDADELTGSFDVKGFKVTDSDISFGLTFSKKDTDINLLSKFTTRSGELEVQGVEAIPDDDDEEEEEEGIEPTRKRGRRSSGGSEGNGTDRSDKDL